MSDFIEEAKRRAVHILPSGGGFYGEGRPGRFNIAMLELLDEKLDSIWQMQQILAARMAPKDPMLDNEQPEEKKSTAPAVDKACEKCGKMMLQVHPRTRYCPECKGA